MKLKRNLTTFEILDQYLQAQKRISYRLTNIVYMGMGEPMLNYENVMRSVEIFTNVDANLVSARHITISTAGIPEGIRRMADERVKCRLAVSLHTLDDKLRVELMPIAKKYPLPMLLEAVEYYSRTLRRRPTFEYILFDGLNDTPDDARRLIALARRMPCKFNVIPFHPIDFAGMNDAESITARLAPSRPKTAQAFVDMLRAYNVTVMVRSSSGKDIDAACGQTCRNTRKRRNFTLVRRLRFRHPSAPQSTYFIMVIARVDVYCPAFMRQK